MNLGEFRKATSHLSDATDLFMGERLTDFRYGLVNSATFKEINMSEEPDGSGECATQEAIILEEE